MRAPARAWRYREEAERRDVRAVGGARRRELRHVRRRRCSRPGPTRSCAPMRRFWLALTAERSPPASRSRPTTRWWGSKAAPRCCAGWARPSPPTPPSSAVTTSRGPAASSTISRAQAEDGMLPAEAILAALLEHLGPIWPGRISLGGVDLGDTWRHPRRRGGRCDGGADALPQALAMAGLFAHRAAAGGGHRRFRAWTQLTGLAEYRNGGLSSTPACSAAGSRGRRQTPMPSTPTHRGMAGAHGGAARRRRRAGAQRRWGSTPEASRWPRCWRAAPGRRDGASPGKNAWMARLLSP